MSDLIEKLGHYFAAREQERTERIEQTLNALTKREQKLVREAAVMGYVRGAMAVGGGVRVTIPPDTYIVADVIGACLSGSASDLYPAINRVAERAQRAARAGSAGNGE